MGKHIILVTNKEMLRRIVIQKLKYILIKKRLKKFVFDAKMVSMAIVGLTKTVREVDKAFRDFGKALPKIKMKPVRVRFKIRKRKKSGLVQ